MQLAKLEQEIIGPRLVDSAATCDIKKWEEKYEKLIYLPHYSHIDSIVVVCVDSLCELTQQIEDVTNINVKLFLRDYYYQIKRVLCQNDKAQAYYLNR